MSFKSLGSVALVFLLSSPSHAGDLFIESCSLGCSSGANGVQVSCSTSVVPQNLELTVFFSEELSVFSIIPPAFQVLDVTTGNLVAGTYIFSSVDRTRVIFRAFHSFDAQGNPVYSLNAGSTYQILIPGQAQGDPGPWITSSAGVPNQSRLQCTVVVEAAVLAASESCSGDGGDQMGCTDCPCGNNAVPGTIGGCTNSSGGAARLLAGGRNFTSEIFFQATGAPADAFAVLTSGSAIAPTGMANPCFGADSGIVSLSLDGLRCAVQGVLRHGVQVSDVNGDIGVTTFEWQPGDVFNLGPRLAGVTRHFQVIHREDPSFACQTGQTTSQAVSVTFIN